MRIHVQGFSGKRGWTLLHQDALRKAAHLAADAVAETCAGYADGTFTHEPTMTGALAGALRVRLKTLSRIAKFSQHQADGRKF
jgi:hypothetical protein